MTQNPDIAQFCASSIRQLASGCPKMRSKFVDLGGMALLVTICAQQSPQHDRTYVDCAANFNLFASDRFSREPMVAQGVVPTLIHLSSISHQDVEYYCSVALAHLSTSSFPLESGTVSTMLSISAPEHIPERLEEAPQALVARPDRVTDRSSLLSQMKMHTCDDMTEIMEENVSLEHFPLVKYPPTIEPQAPCVTTPLRALVESSSSSSSGVTPDAEDKSKTEESLKNEKAGCSGMEDMPMEEEEEEAASSGETVEKSDVVLDSNVCVSIRVIKMQPSDRYVRNMILYLFWSENGNYGRKIASSTLRRKTGAIDAVYEEEEEEEEEEEAVVVEEVVDTMSEDLIAQLRKTKQGPTKPRLLKSNSFSLAKNIKPSSPVASKILQDKITKKPSKPGSPLLSPISKQSGKTAKTKVQRRSTNLGLQPIKGTKTQQQINSRSAKDDLILKSPYKKAAPAQLSSTAKQYGLFQ